MPYVSAARLSIIFNLSIPSSRLLQTQVYYETTTIDYYLDSTSDQITEAYIDYLNRGASEDTKLDDFTALDVIATYGTLGSTEEETEEFALYHCNERQMSLFQESGSPSDSEWCSTTKQGLYFGCRRGYFQIQDTTNRTATTTRDMNGNLISVNITGNDEPTYIANDIDGTINQNYTRSCPAGYFCPQDFPCIITCVRPFLSLSLSQSFTSNIMTLTGNRWLLSRI